MKKFDLISLSMSALLGVLLISCDTRVDDVDGEALVKEVWNAMKTTDLDFIEDSMADEFQSVHQDGCRNKAEEIELIKKLNMGDYVLDTFTVTKNANTMNVSYFVNVEETIDEVTIKKRSARLSVFSKTAEGWKWISHANLVAIKQ